MAICLTWRAFTTALVCMGFSISFAVLGFGVATFVWSLCIALGFRWGFLASDGGIGVPYAMDVLGVLRDDREVFSFLLAFLVVMPLSAVLGYDMVARIVNKLSWPRVLLSKSQYD